MTTAAQVEVREPVSQLVRWCPVGEGWEPDDGKKVFQCSGCDPVHYLRLRRMFVCSVCEMAFFKRTDFNGHVCGEA
jgi:uncharacterized C2H2 Zn-finger protein